MDAISIIDDLHLINLDFLHIFQNNLIVVINIFVMLIAGCKQLYAAIKTTTKMIPASSWSKVLCLHWYKYVGV